MKHWFYIESQKANRQTHCIFDGITTPEFAAAVAMAEESRGSAVRVSRGKSVRQLVYESGPAVSKEAISV